MNIVINRFEELNETSIKIHNLHRAYVQKWVSHELGVQLFYLKACDAF